MLLIVGCVTDLIGSYIRPTGFLAGSVVTMPMRCWKTIFTSSLKLGLSANFLLPREVLDPTLKRFNAYDHNTLSRVTANKYRVPLEQSLLYPVLPSIHLCERDCHQHPWPNVDVDTNAMIFVPGRRRKKGHTMVDLEFFSLLRTFGVTAIQFVNKLDGSEMIPQCIGGELDRDTY